MSVHWPIFKEKEPCEEYVKEQELKMLNKSCPHQKGAKCKVDCIHFEKGGVTCALSETYRFYTPAELTDDKMKELMHFKANLSKCKLWK